MAGIVFMIIGLMQIAPISIPQAGVQKLDTLFSLLLVREIIRWYNFKVMMRGMCNLCNAFSVTQFIGRQQLVYAI